MPERDQPDLEAKLESGELKVSQLSQVQSFIRQEKKSGKIYGQDEKRELLLEVSGKSARETEKVLAEKNPEFSHREKIRAVTAELTQITFTANEELMENLKRLRDLFAHELPPGASHADLISWMSEKMLRIHEKKMEPKVTRPKSQGHSAPPTSEVNSEPTSKVQAPFASREEAPSRYIPVEVKREVWMRDQGRCVYVSPTTGRVCGSRHRLQLDHRKPFSYGGPTTAANLRILCHTHNQSEARRIFGKRARS
jgi:hypothetical protein